MRNIINDVNELAYNTRKQITTHFLNFQESISRNQITVLNMKHLLNVNVRGLS